MEPETLKIWKSLASKPGGKWIFSRLLCFKAPYFGTVAPLFMALGPGRCEIRIRKRRSVLNHIGTVHAIAMCNVAELAAGTMTEVTLPPTHRWIPKAMTVQYRKKAATDLVAVATPLSSLNLDSAGDFIVSVEVMNTGRETVLEAEITMWVSPRR